MKKLKLFLSILFITFLFTKNWAQSNTLTNRDSIYSSSIMKTDITLITGYHFHENHFFEIGLGVKRNGRVGHHFLCQIPWKII